MKSITKWDKIIIFSVAFGIFMILVAAINIALTKL